MSIPTVLKLMSAISNLTKVSIYISKVTTWKQNRLPTFTEARVKVADLPSCLKGALIISGSQVFSFSKTTTLCGTMAITRLALFLLLIQQQTFFQVPLQRNLFKHQISNLQYLLVISCQFLLKTQSSWQLWVSLSIGSTLNLLKRQFFLMRKLIRLTSKEMLPLWINKNQWLSFQTEK